jgi:hypothetical protein
MQFLVKLHINIKNNWSICEILLQRLVSGQLILHLIIRPPPMFPSLKIKTQNEAQRLPTGFPRHTFSQSLWRINCVTRTATLVSLCETFIIWQNLLKLVSFIERGSIACTRGISPFSLVGNVLENAPDLHFWANFLGSTPRISTGKLYAFSTWLSPGLDLT